MQQAPRISGRLTNIAAICAIVIAILSVPFVGMELSPTDAYVYLAAGERLNAGHELYAIGPGDRFIGLNPPYWTVPILSPPLMAVVWRPLAVLGIAGMLIGWALAGAAFLAAIAVVVKRTPILGLAATILLAIPIGWQLGLGNVNGFLVLGIVLLWLVRDRPWIAGALVAVMVGVKVTPIVLVAWLAVTGRWRAVGAFVVVSIALGIVSVAGAGWPAHLEYLGVIAQTTTAGMSNLSLAGLLRALGVPSQVAGFTPWAALVAGAVALVALRRRPGAAFAVAVLMLVVGSPVVQLYWYALLVAALIPVADARSPSSDRLDARTVAGTFAELPRRPTNAEG